MSKAVLRKARAKLAKLKKARTDLLLKNIPRSEDHQESKELKLRKAKIDNYRAQKLKDLGIKMGPAFYDADKRANRHLRAEAASKIPKLHNPSNKKLGPSKDLEFEPLPSPNAGVRAEANHGIYRLFNWHSNKHSLFYEPHNNHAGGHSLGHYSSREEGIKAAQEHHTIQHYGLKTDEVNAVKQAWPEGVHRLSGAHPEMVLAQVKRAKDAMEKSAIQRNRGPGMPTEEDRGTVRSTSAPDDWDGSLPAMGGGVGEGDAMKSERATRILMVEDREGRLTNLRSIKPHAEIVLAPTVDEAMHRVMSEDWDEIWIDYDAEHGTLGTSVSFKPVVLLLCALRFPGQVVAHSHNPAGADWIVSTLKNYGLKAMIPPQETLDVLWQGDEPHDHPAKDGLILALWLQGHDAKELTTPEGERPDELHVTLLYVGKKDDLEPGTFERVCEIAEKYAEGTPPVEALLTSDFKRFPAERHLEAIVAPIKSESLVAMHLEVLHRLKSMGIPVTEKFPDFKPHITLAYVPKDFTPSPMAFPERKIAFPVLSVAMGPERRDFPFYTGDLVQLQKTEESLPGMVVPKGGSSCAKCQYLAEDGKHCANANWIAWWSKKSGHQTSLIPAPADEYCCNYYDWDRARLKK